LIYNNLIYFLVVILILTTNTAAGQPQFQWLTNIAFFLVKAVIYQGLLGTIFSRARVNKASTYSTAERRGSILAIIVFSLDVYLLDSQYYFGLLPGARTLPVVGSLANLLLFSGYLTLMWAKASERYRVVFHSQQTAGAFAWTNLQTNLPIILPWLCLSLLADLLQQSDLPLIRTVMSSAWGEQAIFMAFFLCLAIIFPILVTKMWGCTPLPRSPARSRIEEFCREQRVGYAEILLWPLHEGQALTAGVMGIMTPFRYLLVTPALLTALSPEEIEAVIAHELGHVKKRHLQIFLLLFMGFGLLAQLSSYPILYLLTNSDLFYRMIHLTNNKPSNALAFASTAPLFVLMIVYFRFILGFFMRNFERQADLYALKTMKTCSPLIRVFEKIAWLSGEIRDLPSWHHFGIGERIECLQRCDQAPERIKAHDRKVYGALLSYGVVLTVAAFTLWRMPQDLQEGPPREKFAEAVIVQKMEEEPRNYLWHQLLGDLQYSRQHYPEAVREYQKAIELSPDQPEILNNLAWLLLTVEEKEVFNPGQALPLAKKAVILQPSGHILDTLALAYWHNGAMEQAVLAEQRAMDQDPSNRDYYAAQRNKFRYNKPPTR
jgi:Zn-dependent protease with chaperone function